jgi:enamine deaminase RidA (YjgF/YER057c/UK114 family)
MENQSEIANGRGRVQYVNPDNLNKNPAFSNLVVVTGQVKTIYVGGQDAVDASGMIIGKGDLKAQTVQVLKNIQAALDAGGAAVEHVVKWNVYVVQGQSFLEGFEAFQSVFGTLPNPPAITAMFVAGLAHPDFLVEMDAIAVVPQSPYSPEP